MLTSTDEGPQNNLCSRVQQSSSSSWSLCALFSRRPRFEWTPCLEERRFRKGTGPYPCYYGMHATTTLYCSVSDSGVIGNRADKNYAKCAFGSSAKLDTRSTTSLWMILMRKEQ
uniref:Uncharacterized protein n=1 Tax=Entomoneis paludosa TaxID=265537 RepID=A0A7S2YFN0_9STRA|mmetsp:Transcript_31179/g.65053  ORF Transcript_31179/g.65053 Transcript_31179/m.65053 type:complete len:114 (+) Transcript_31179:118-459(+)